MFTLDRVVPWGRSFDEYRRMFALTADDLQMRILGCGDGPSSFNAEATRAGSRVVSFDPIYRFSVPDIRERIGREKRQPVLVSLRGLNQRARRAFKEKGISDGEFRERQKC